MADGLPIHTMVQLRLFMQHHGFAVWIRRLALAAAAESSAAAALSDWVGLTALAASACAGLIDQLIAIAAVDGGHSSGPSDREGPPACGCLLLGKGTTCSCAV
jgi:hypothetical protein